MILWISWLRLCFSNKIPQPCLIKSTGSCLSIASRRLLRPGLLGLFSTILPHLQSRTKSLWGNCGRGPSVCMCVCVPQPVSKGHLQVARTPWCAPTKTGTRKVPVFTCFGFSIGCDLVPWFVSWWFMCQAYCSNCFQKVICFKLSCCRPFALPLCSGPLTD